MTEQITLRARALRMLSRREYARAELSRRLAPYGTADEIESVLDDLVARALLSDERYAETHLRTRSARFGNARLKLELREAGVADDLATHALADIGDELTRACEIWRRKYGEVGLPGENAESSERSRQANFLMRRGFSGETVRRVLRGACENG